MVVVAQPVRASDCGSEGRGFKSPHPPEVPTNFVGTFFVCKFEVGKLVIKKQISKKLYSLAGLKLIRVTIRKIRFREYP